MLFRSCDDKTSSETPQSLSPAINKLNPNIGIEKDVISIIGKRFSPNIDGNVVKFGGIRATVLTANDTLITVEVPNGVSTGIVTITVNNRTTNGPAFTYGKASVESDEDGNEVAYDYITSTYAGAGVQGNVLGDKDVARFMLPNGVSFDPTTGDLIVADRSAHSIKRITKDGKVELVAGIGTAGRVDGDIKVASFNNPYKTAVDKLGNIYVADNSNNKIRKIDIANQIVSTIAGGGTAGNTSGYTDGVGIDALFSTPTGVAVDDNFNVYVADAANHVIRKIFPDKRVATLAGIGATPGINDGLWPNVTMNRPTAVCMGKDGFLYAADRYGQRIRKIDVNTGYTVTIAGSGGSAASTGGYVDGEALKARFNNIWGMDIDKNGVIYVSELEGSSLKSHAVRMVKNGQVSTIGGVVSFNAPGFVNGGVGISRFNNPADVTVDDEGNVYVGDQSNYVIRKITRVKK